MKALLIFSLVPAAIGLHVLLATKFAIYDRLTLIPLVIMLPAVGMLAGMLFQAPAKSLWVLNITAWVLVAFFVWWTRAYSSYDGERDYSGPDSVGEALAQIEVVDWQGNAFPFEQQMGSHQALLLVFYRGVW